MTLPAFTKNLDILLLESPMRYVPMLPNGLGYVYNCLKPLKIKMQAVDLNIHYFHERNQPDLWSVVSAFQFWAKPEWVRDTFQREINEVFDAIVDASPKIVGLSVGETNHHFAREVVDRIRRALPETVIIVGGYDCTYRECGPANFPDFDYMAIGEADLTLPPLVQSLLKGERPHNLLGIIEDDRYLSHPRRRQWQTDYYPKDIDSLEFPKYEWSDYSYLNLVPLMMSRGCPWGRCHFCAERFPFRVRDPRKVIKEVEWFYLHGYSNFLFGDSCLNSDLDTLATFCQELIKLKRYMNINFSGQFHVSKDGTKELFTLLKEAGCGRLAFGVDGWTDRLAKLQNKGYTFKMVEENLRNCHEAGIAVAVNMVIGIPGETEVDIDEAIENIIKCKPYISIFQNFNTLILACGSDYYQEPEKYGICFRENKTELYQKHPSAIPIESWYSDQPNIDDKVRSARLERIYKKLNEAGIPMNDYAQWQVTKRWLK